MCWKCRYALVNMDLTQQTLKKMIEARFSHHLLSQMFKRCKCIRLKVDCASLTIHTMELMRDHLCVRSAEWMWELSMRILSQSLLILGGRLVPTIPQTPDSC